MTDEKKEHIFYCGRDFRGIPQVILVIANDKSQAEEMLDKQRKIDGGFEFDKIRPLQELNIHECNTIIIEPPGDGNTIYPF